MTTLTQDVFSIVKQITETISFPSLQAEIQNLNRLRPAIQANHASGLQQVLPVLDKIFNLYSSVQTAMWTSEHEAIAGQLGLKKFTGETGRKIFEDLKNQLRSNTATSGSTIQAFVQELNQPISKVTQLLTLLQPFNLESNIKVLNAGEGIIEITFDGDVRIDDFQEARDQMNNWFLIILGYASLLDARREDFEIISMSKHSPAKFKIKTTLTSIGLILAIISSLLLIEKTILENKLTIEKLKQNSLVPDSEFQKKFIQDAEKNMEETVQKEIGVIVDKKLKEYNIQEGNGDVKNNLSKGIHNQYNFIINGGNVTVNVIDGQIQQQVDSLEKTKQEIKQIKEAYENQKAITVASSDTTKENSNDDTP